uniref:HMG box domain-containing protein n=1 Tax=Eptatretus burgeri TaxID=7764 RepID=A0A8C4R7W3_EPTBU
MPFLNSVFHLPHMLSEYQNEPFTQSWDLDGLDLLLQDDLRFFFDPPNEQPDQAKQQIDHMDVIPDRQPQKQPEDDWSSSFEDSPVNYDNDVLWTPTHQRGHKLSQNHQKHKGRKAYNPKMSRRVVKSPYEVKKKCVNGFIMFCRINRKLYIKEHPGMPSTRATCALATLWHQMSTEEKKPYCVKAQAFSQVNNRNVHIDNNTAVVDIEIAPQSLPMVPTDSVYGTDKRTLDASDHHIKMNIVSGFHKNAMTKKENDGLIAKSQKSRNPKRQKLVHEARGEWMENPRVNPHREKNAFLDKDMFIW